jgi:hypothetical protein
MIDDIVYYLIIAAILVPIGVAVGAETLAQLFLDMSFVTSWLLFGVVRAGYYVLCEATTGRTVGKLVSGTRVVTESGGKPTTLQSCSGRSAGWCPSNPSLSLDRRPAGMTAGRRRVWSWPVRRALFRQAPRSARVGL